MTASASASAPRPADDDDAPEFEQEFHDGPPVAGVLAILATIGVIVWVGISLALMAAIDHHGAWLVLR